MALFQKLTQPKARVPATKFTRVKNLETSKEGSVQDRLSSQFTVEYDDKTFGFLFYKDKDVTWLPLDEKKEEETLKYSFHYDTTMWDQFETDMQILEDLLAPKGV